MRNATKAIIKEIGGKQASSMVILTGSGIMVQSSITDRHEQIEFLCGIIASIASDIKRGGKPFVPPNKASKVH